MLSLVLSIVLYAIWFEIKKTVMLYHQDIRKAGRLTLLTVVCAACLKNKINSDTPLCSCPYPFHAPHPLPQRTNARHPLPPGAPNARRSGDPLPNHGEINRAGARSMEVARRCCRGVGGPPPPLRGALSTPGDTLSHPDD
jgi:hypothetical protein